MDVNKKKLKMVPLDCWDRNCFGCSPDNHHGLKMEFFTDGELFYAEPHITEKHCGWDKLVHGGILSTILDEIMCWHAIYTIRTPAVTKKMSLEYKSAVFNNEKIKAISYISSNSSGREITLHGELLNHEDKVCTTAAAIYTSFKPNLIKRMNLMDERSLNQFNALIESWT